MKSMWGDDRRQEIKDRVARVTPDRKAQWGKVSAPQMMCHLERLSAARFEPACPLQKRNHLRTLRLTLPTAWLA
jgi:hypothetical protein